MGRCRYGAEQGDSRRSPHLHLGGITNDITAVQLRDAPVLLCQAAHLCPRLQVMPLGQELTDSAESL